MIADSAQKMDFSMCYIPPNLDGDCHEKDYIPITAEVNYSKECVSYAGGIANSFYNTNSKTDYETALNEYKKNLANSSSKSNVILVPHTETTLIKEQIKKLDPNAIIPIRGTKFAACKDLYSPIDTVVPAGKNLLIKTNIAIAWDNPNYYIQLLSRSGLTYKYNVVVQAGVIDRDYFLAANNNIGVLLQNNSDVDFVVRRSDRIAQYAYVKINTEESEVVEEFTFSLDSDRKGGWGSTGK